MAQDKRVFIGGMDKDSDPRLIKNGDYRDALNIRNIASMDGTSGSVENIEGNTLVPFRFIDEVDEVIEFSASDDGQIIVEEVPVEQVFVTQTIEFRGKEEYNFIHTFDIEYFSVSESDDGVLIPNGTSYATNQNGSSASVSWTGIQSRMGTAQALLNKFGPGGDYEILTVQDHTTGNNINIKVSSILTSSGSNVTENTVFDSNTPIRLTYRAEQANTNFLLDFSSSNSQFEGMLWSQTVSEQLPNGKLFIASSFATNAPNGSMTLGSTFGVDSMDDSDGINYNVDDEGNSYGFGLNEDSAGSTIDLEITGIEPTNNGTTVVNDVNIYTWDQISGNGDSPNDFNVNEFINLSDKVNDFGSGGEYEFSDQQQFSEFFSDIVKNPDQGGSLGPVIVTGGSGLVTNLASVNTNFLPNTTLNTERNTASERNTNADAKTYNLLEYYYDDTEILEAAGFTINQGTITFSGEDVANGSNIKGGEYYTLKGNFIAGVSYKLTYNVSGLPSGNSFTFSIFDVNTESDPISSDGAKETFITPTSNSIYLSIEFLNDFSATDLLTISNLRLFIESQDVENFKIRFQTSSTFDFNLAFATSEEQLKHDLSVGNVQSKVNSWFPGVALNLNKLTSGNQEVNVIENFEPQDLEAQLADLTDKYEQLQNDFDLQESEHQQELADLQAAADTDSAAASAELAAAQDANNTLNEEIDNLASTIGSLENLIDEIDDPKSDTELIDVLAQYDSGREDVQASLQNIIADLNNINTDLINSDSIQSQYEENLQSLNDAQTEISELELQIESKEQEIVTLSRDLAVANSTLAGNSALIEVLENQASTLTSSLSSSQSQIDSLTALTTSLQSTIDDKIDQFSSVTAQSISDLSKTLSDITQLLTNPNIGFVENLDGTFSSLSDKLDDLSVQVDNLDEELQEASTGNTTSGSDLTQEIDELILLNQSFSGLISAAQDSLNNLELNSNNPDFSISSLNEQLNSLISSYSTIESSFNSLSSTYNNNLISAYSDGFAAGSASISADDGITQADVDAAFDAGVASVDVINIINLYNDTQPSPAVTEHIFENHFELPINRWSGTNWVFENSFAIADRLNYGQPGVLTQSNDLREGNYILNLNILNISKNGSLTVVFESSVGNQSVKIENITSLGFNIFEVLLPFPCSKIHISTSASSIAGAKRFSVSIDSISLTSFTNDGTATPNLIMELLASIRQINSANRNLQLEIFNNRAVINSLNSQLESARDDLNLYVNSFSETNDSLFFLAESIQNVISDFSLSSSTTSIDVTNLQNQFLSNQNDASEQIENQQSLIKKLIDILNDLDGSSTPSDQVSNNEKWLFTFSGGVPVTTNYPNFIPYNFAIGIRNQNIPDLGYVNGQLTNALNMNPSSSFLENGGFQFLKGMSNFTGQRLNTIPYSSIQNNDPESIILNFLNESTNRLNYNAELNSHTTGEAYDSNPNVFIVNFYSSENDKSYDIKFTVHVNLKSSLVDINGNQYTDTGDKIVGDDGTNRPIQVSTAYLENNEIGDGFQVEVEFLGGETGWNMELIEGSNSTYISSSANSYDIFVNETPHSFNITNTFDPDRQTTPSFKLHAEKLQEAQSTRRSADTRGGVEQFVSALSMPSYNENSFSAPEEYSYPSSGSDIIKNKSQNRKEKLSSVLLAAKRIVKNKI
tara:strand:- start:15944 stop:20932 length:4989 start_codon:yes stop_codon:yes gene_type:complete